MITRHRFQRLFILVSATFACVAAHAYQLGGSAWPSGNVTLQLQLGSPAAPLMDGSTSWDDVALAAIEEWNTVMVRSKLVGVKSTSTNQTPGNRLNEVYFGTTYNNEAFDSRMLAVTLRLSSALTLIEADTVVNLAHDWNSYRGALTGNRREMRRVLIHEFGHSLGLDHPNEAEPPQTVAAIMNSAVNNVETLQDDDKAAARTLYGETLTPPAGGTLSGDVTLNAGQPLTLTYTSTSSTEATVWTFQPNGGEIQELQDGDGEPWEGKTFSLFSAQETDAGTYRVAAANFAGMSAISTARVTVNSVDTTNALLANLSARGRAGSGDNTFIVGFVITGSTPKTVLIRAVGPSLQSAGVNNPLANPKLTLNRRNSSGGFDAIADNDDWSSGASIEVTAIRNTAVRLGASPLLDGTKDAALLITLTPGVYTALVDAQGGTPGIALLEVYDADETRSLAQTRRLVNVSTRSYAGVGEEMLFSGFVVNGPAPKQVLIRAIGPGLISRGVNDANTDPNLVIFKNGTAIADNDDWAHSNQGLHNFLAPIFTKVGAFQLETTDWDSALLITLPPGVYSAQVSGRNGETGVVLLEVYEVPE